MLTLRREGGCFNVEYELHLHSLDASTVQFTVAGVLHPCSVQQELHSLIYNVCQLSLSSVS